MPIYEYRCETCGKERAELQSMNADAPACCEGKMKKLVSAPFFSLSGTGWARDGYGGGHSEGHGLRQRLGSIPTVTQDGGLIDPRTRRPILNPDGSKA